MSKAKDVLEFVLKCRPVGLTMPWKRVGSQLFDKEELIAIIRNRLNLEFFCSPRLSSVNVLFLAKNAMCDEMAGYVTSISSKHPEREYGLFLGDEEEPFKLFIGDSYSVVLIENNIVETSANCRFKPGDTVYYVEDMAMHEYEVISAERYKDTYHSVTVMLSKMHPDGSQPFTQEAHRRVHELWLTDSQEDWIQQRKMGHDAREARRNSQQEVFGKRFGFLLTGIK